MRDWLVAVGGLLLVVAVIILPIYAAVAAPCSWYAHVPVANVPLRCL